MLISFDIDGVLAEANYIGEEAWQTGGKEEFGKHLLDLKPRFPELIPYINRLKRHHVVQINSARCRDWWGDTDKWLNMIGLRPSIIVNCLGDRKLKYLKELKPDLHFDDHEDYVQEAWGVHVWHPSWSDTPSGDMVSSAEEIIERISYEKNKKYGSKVATS